MGLTFIDVKEAARPPAPSPRTLASLQAAAKARIWRAAWLAHFFDTFLSAREYGALELRAAVDHSASIHFQISKTH
ncbi:MAG: hypothetical protein WC811_10785 [Hyphomicrobium sp.]|jgi:hypothetical protein